MENKTEEVKKYLRKVLPSGTVKSKATAKEIINGAYKRYGIDGAGKCTDLKLFGISYTEGKVLDPRTKKYVNTIKID